MNKTPEKFKRYVSSMEECAIVTLDKPLVDWLLEINTHNRKPKKATIDNYRAEIREGKWIVTSQGIGISKKNDENEVVLLDGQHRLLAVKEEGYPPVRTLLSWGLDRRAQTKVDIHSKRSASDWLSLLLDEGINEHFASAVRLIFFIEKEGRAWATERVCQEALEEVAEEFLPHIKALTFPAYAGINGAFVAATSIAVAHGASAVKVQEFIDRFRDGKNLGDGNPILRLREIMRDVKRLSKESRFSVYAYYLAAFLTGRRIRLNYRTIEVRQAHDLLVAAAEK